MCLACHHFDFNSADCDHQLIFANNRKGIYLSVQETFVGQERVTNSDEPLRTSAWEDRRTGDEVCKGFGATTRTRSTSTSVNNN